MKKIICACIGLVLSIALIGCPPTGVPINVRANLHCVPGTQLTCSCLPGNPNGVQVCKADATGFAPCQCPTPTTPSGG